MATLLDRIISLQVKIVRELNDIHIFTRQALPLLDEARRTHAASTHTKDRQYFVPSIRRERSARRTDAELKEIFDLFCSRRLYEAFLTTAIVEFEGFLERVLREVLRKYPKKLGISVPGVSACNTTSLDAVLACGSVAEILDRTIDDHLRAVFFAAPRTYMKYFSKVVGTNVGGGIFLSYYEIKATRDLLVHTDRIINSIYLEKAGVRARGSAGQRIAVDSDYFDLALATLKRLTGIIKRDAVTTFTK